MCPFGVFVFVRTCTSTCARSLPFVPSCSSCSCSCPSLPFVRSRRSCLPFSLAFLFMRLCSSLPRTRHRRCLSLQPIFPRRHHSLCCASCMNQS